MNHCRRLRTVNDLRPPRFLYLDVVRVLASTGLEVGYEGYPVDVTGVVGEELVVEDAVPAAERDGWLIAVRRFEGTGDWMAWFAEDSLEGTGRTWLPLDEHERAWRDRVSLSLVADRAQEGEDATPAERRRPDALAEAAAAALAELVPTEEITWRQVDEEYALMRVDLTVYPTGDALQAYERIVAEPSRGWRHGENGQGFLRSTWETPIAGRLVFLVPGVREATVTCEYWSSPEQQSLRGQ